MTGFEPRDEAFRDRVRGSFQQQAFVNFIGAELTLVEPGAVDIALDFKGELAQQHGYVHGGVITAIADAAAELDDLDREGVWEAVEAPGSP